MPDGAAGQQRETASRPVEATIEDYFSEDRVFPPSQEFVDGAVLADGGVYQRAESDWRGFWAEQAGALDWFRP